MDANDKQIGGSHYKHAKIQHWDIVEMYNMDYYIGNATKYLFRFGKKGSLQNHIDDLYKAMHYIEKRIAIAQRDLDAVSEAMEEERETYYVNVER